jgi:hypothetical protein
LPMSARGLFRHHYHLSVIRIAAESLHLRS